MESDEDDTEGQFRDDGYEESMARLKRLVEKNQEAEEDSGDESDYEFAGGEVDEYRSPVMESNEFLCCGLFIQGLSNTKPDIYRGIFQGMDPSAHMRLMDAFNTAETLEQRYRAVS